MVGFVKSALNLLGLNNAKKEGVEVSPESGHKLEEFLENLPAQLGMDIKFVKRTDKEEPGLHYDIEGPDADELLGQSCEVLDALSHVCMRVLRKNEGLSNAPLTEGIEHYRVTFDSSDFRSKKTQELKDMASEHRKRVIDSGGKPSYIRALSPSDRKVIHTTLADLGEVTSESIGKGNFKRIRIKLKDDSQFKREPAPRNQTRDESEGTGNFSPRNHGGGGGRRNSRGGQGGGQQGGRGGRNFRNNNGGGRSQNFRRDPSSEINGNTNTPEPINTKEIIDDNIGNRLQPGESHIFSSIGSRNRPNGNGQ
jgi:predicted RNA-binding protein Jag